LPPTVRRLLASDAHHPPKALMPLSLPEARALYDSGAPVTHVAAALGLNAAAFRKLRLLHNWPLRPSPIVRRTGEAAAQTIKTPKAKTAKAKQLKPKTSKAKPRKKNPAKAKASIAYCTAD